MQTILHELTSLFSSTSGMPLSLSPSTNEKFGHYQCNSAMKLVKELKKNPRQIAEEIVQKVGPSPLIEKLEIEGPGFINVTLKPAYLAKRLKKMLTEPRLGVLKQEPPQKIIIDFSSPNTAKEMHVGHLRSTVIGDCLARVFEFLGDNVLRLNHIGDWGTAFGMLIAFLKLNHPGIISGDESATLTDLVNWYKASKVLFDQDPAFKKQSQLEVVALQGGNPESLKTWSFICHISLKAYHDIYDLLDVKVIDRGESYYNPLLPGIVSDLESKGLITISNGAKCLYVEGFQNREGESLPLMIQKSDGGYNYDTTDMAAIRQRVNEEKADRLIYVTDQGQSTHFHMVFKAAEKAGYIDPKKVRCDHVGFGLVLGADGKKFRTRSGDTEKLIDLLTAAIDEARRILKERSPDLAKDALDHAAKVLGLSAIKYADLSCHRMSDYQFSYDKMLKFEGNTAAFILYSFVRVGGIKRKVGIDVNSLIEKEDIVLSHPSEIALALHLAQFPEMLEQLAESLLPNRMTEYLFTLAEKFNAFFRDCRVEGSLEQNSRLQLAELTARVLKQGLNLLGIETLESM